MKTNQLQQMVAVMVVTSMSWAGASAGAGDSSAASTGQVAAVSAPAPQLSYGVAQILQLAQAKVSDDTILAYINNSGNHFDLNAEQIIYLRLHGISDIVINTMLNQPRPAVAAAMTTTTAPQPAAASAKTVSPVASGPVKGATLLRSSTAGTETVSTTTNAPPVMSVQTVPVPAPYYYQPYYYPYYYPYGWYPPVSFYFGWGGGWHGGGHGGWHGGGHH